MEVTRETGCFGAVSIAANALRQRVGIGRALVEGAYRKVRFAVTSLGEKYPGIARYACLLEAPVSG
jgi:hypothetical protein